MPRMIKAGPGKNRRGRMLALLLAMTALAAAAAYFALQVPEAPQITPAPAATATPTLVSRPVSDVTSILVERAEERYALLAQDGSYILEGSAGFAIDQSRARDLALACAYLFYEDMIDAPGNLSDYGLDNPSAVVTVTYTDADERTFLLGNKTPSGTRYYLMEQGSGAVYIVYASTGESFMTPRRSLHAFSMPQIKAGDIARASLTNGDGDTVTVGFDPSRETAGISALWLTEPFVYEADAERVSEYFDSIAGIRLTGFESDVPGEFLSQYGLDAPRYRLAVYGTDADGHAAQIMSLHIGADKDAHSTYARIDDTGCVYLLDRPSVVFLADITAARLVDRYVNLISLAKVDTIEVEARDNSILLAIDRRAGAGAEAYSVGGETVGAADFRALYQTLIGLQADGLLPDGWTPNDNGMPALCITYHLNTAREMERIEYLPYDANHYAVRRNGVCLLYILRSRVDGIPDALHAYSANGSEKDILVPSPGTL